MKNNKLQRKRSLWLLFLTLLMSIPVCSVAFAMEVPIQETCQEVNGRQVLTRVYEVSENLDPAELISADFEKDNFVYSFDSIIKTENEFSDTKREVQNFEVISETNDLSANIIKFPSTIAYKDGDGYEGLLYLDPRSISTDATGYHTQARVSKQVMVYPDMAYNDPSLVPVTIQKYGNTLPLAYVEWAEEEFLTDSSVPATYTATATYKKTSYAKVADGYKISAEYVGDVTESGLKSISYTISYLGERDSWLASGLGGAFLSGTLAMVFLLLIAVLTFLVLALLKWRRKRIVTIQAQDDLTGEYSTTQRVRLKKDSPVIKLNTMKLPGARHYVIKINAGIAEQLIGKVITVYSPEQTFQHQVGNTFGKDYVFDVSFELGEANASTAKGKDGSRK